MDEKIRIERLRRLHREITVRQYPDYMEDDKIHVLQVLTEKIEAHDIHAQQ